MIYEYAIEPDLAVEWGKNRADYRYFLEKFSLGSPRIMAEFPKFKNWRKQFKQAAASADETKELPLITEIFTMLKERHIHRNSFNYDGTLSWLENAELENTRQQFQAILSRTNPRHHAKVLASNTVDTNPFWRVEKQASCPRRANDMAKLLAPMLVNCLEIHFIDPHFGPENLRHRKPLEAFLNIIAKRPSCRPKIDKIVIHTSGKADFDFFKQNCEEKLRAIIPAGICLILQRWNQWEGGEKLHERYILSDIGGLKVDPGLDDGKQGESFEVLLLERNLYEKHWGNYVTNPAFERAEDPIEIIGPKG